MFNLNDRYSRQTVPRNHFKIFNMKAFATIPLFLLLFCLTESNAQCYSLVWQEEFSGTSLNTANWNYWIGGAFNNELQYYTDRQENVSVSNGTLKLTARAESFGGYNYTSGRIDTRQKFDFTYGKVESRIKLVNGQGFWPAFWLLPTSGNWPNGGEIDIMELLGHQPNKTYGTCHFVSGGNHTYLGSNWTLPSGNFSQGFHTFAVEWTPSQIKWSVNGQIYYTVTKTQIGSSNWPFNKDFYVILNLAVGGNWPGSPNGSTVFPSAIEVDWVRVYQRNTHIKMSGSEITSPHTATNYKVPTWAGAAYNWSVSTGGTIVSGQNTSQISVNWGTSGNHSVSCTFENNCGAQTLSKAVAVSPNLWSNPSFEFKARDWTFLSYSGAAATFTTPNNSAAPHGSKVGRVVVSTLGSDHWNVQLTRPNIFVQKDSSYTLRFHARSTAAGKNIQVNFLNPTNFTNYAWLQPTLTTSWQQYQLTFTAPYTGNLLFTNDFGFQTGTFFVDNYIFGRTSQLQSFAPTATGLTALTDEKPSELADMDGLKVYPTQFSEQIFIESATGGRFELLDAFGRSCATGAFLADERFVLSTGHFATGSYFLKITPGIGQTKTFPIIKN